MRRATLKDVAEQAGVGKVTASYVLNGRSRVARISEKTEERVLKIAGELNYRPNAVGRMLSQRRSEAIAVVFQYANYFSSLSSFTSEAMRGVCAACVEAGYDLMLHTKPADDPDCEASALMDGRVDGVLALRDRNDPTLGSVIANQFPCVVFFSRPDDPITPFVDSDNFAGGKLAAEHLLQLGHTNVAIVVGAPGSVASNDRMLGFKRVYDEEGVCISSRSIVRLESPGADSQPFIDLMKSPDRPTGVFVWSEDVAFVCMNVITELGLSIPEDVSIIGYDSSEACLRAVPPLTSVRQPVFEMAARATKLLVDIVRKVPLEQTHIVFKPELDIRESTSLAPFSDTHRRGPLHETQ